MYQVTVEQCFDSAHFLSGYQGKCSNIHGHRWRVIVLLETEQLCEEGKNRGMLEDFSVLKERFRELFEAYDHTLLAERGSLKETTLSLLKEEGFSVKELAFRPTAENFARHFYEMIAEKGYRVAKVTVYETPNNCASYYES